MKAADPIRAALVRALKPYQRKYPQYVATELHDYDFQKANFVLWEAVSESQSA